ncbi:hypothetical protein SELMODRAFT_410210 [Selaginella moellendorffii]|uniref:F-box domain-containing protein n=1 Tax=Selaginella moellendorffii TaxID=88036 RepID=D8RE00_SELML|nr:F-box/kelch-repeat protein At5g15710 [Selaginella moellendorffii]EFJ29346.1 hypothetical protein SELMODRAFT_410210 [Selaginella moellendorffii]|eukprot:XP_002969258.1 F-box/kelch-repeat protein At5g15710 [Selaginella moellendorffii]
MENKKPLLPPNKWLHLPLELHEKIFALLPIAAITRCRAVCHTWRSILLSPPFLQHWARIAAPIPWFLMFRDHKFRAYSPALGTWHDIPAVNPSDHALDLTCIVASAGGLLFLSSQKKKKGSPPLLLVCNPLTKSCRILPGLSRITLIYVMGMMESGWNSYKILVAGVASSSSQELITEIYDSASGGWECQSSARLDAFQDFSGMRAVWSDGFFYCLSVPPYKLVAYDMGKRSWITLDHAQQLPALAIPNLASASLLVCRGRLVMAAKITGAAASKRVRIWEFDAQSCHWKDATANSDPVLQEFCKCVSYFMALQRPRGLDSVCFNSWCRWRTLMYDVSQKKWHWLPEHCGRFKDMLSGLTYEPTFLARA